MPKNEDPNVVDTDEDATLAEMLGETAEGHEADIDMEGIDPNHPVLSVEEQKAARAEARAAIESERRKAALKAFTEKEKQRLKETEGLVTGDGAKDEIVTILINLPEFCSFLGINGTQYHHGHTYKVPRHAADSLREQQSRAWDHQLETEGKNKTDRIRNQASQAMRPANVLSGKVAA